MDAYFNELSKNEQRIFIINKLLSDDLFKEYHDDFKHKYTQYIESNKKQDEKQKFIDLYKSHFDKYTQTLYKIVNEPSRYKDNCIELISIRQDIEEISQNKHILSKDDDNNTFVDNLIILYEHSNNIDDNEYINLERTIKRMFLNNKITKKYRDKYKKYIDKYKDIIYSDDDNFEYIITHSEK